MRVNDTDSDGDGIPDADERWLGFNPFSNRTDRQDLTDDVRIKTTINAASVVTVGTLDPRMSERWPDPGLVAVRRRGADLGERDRIQPARSEIRGTIPDPSCVWTGPRPGR